MCIGGGSSRRAADAAAAEAQRQYALEVERLRQEAIDAKAAADARATTDAQRHQTTLDTQKADAELLRNQLRDQETFRLSEMARIEADRKKEREADLLAQAAEKKAAEEVAKGRAAALTTYNVDRQALIDRSRGQIESAFAGYDDNYYGGLASNVVDYYRPQIAQQHEDARRATTFRQADRGNLRSTASARLFGRLDQQRGQAENEAASRGMAYANDVRSQVQSQRANLLNSVFGAANSAPVITADNIGEAGNSLSQLSRGLSVPVSLAGSGVSTSPSFGQLSTVFNVPGVGQNRQQNSAGGARYVNSFGGGSGRLVA